MNDSLENDLKEFFTNFQIKNGEYLLEGVKYAKGDLATIRLLKNKFYDRYNKTQFLRIPAQNMIKEYINILKKVEKSNKKNNWFVKESTGNDTVLVQRGLIEKVFSTQIYNPSIQVNKNMIGQIMPFEYPYFYIDDDFFWLLGKDFPVITNDELVRFYFNFDVNHLEGIRLLFRFLLNEFDETNISYKVKLPIDKARFNRADNVVLYLDKLHLRIAMPAIRQLVNDLSAYLKPDVPLFTRKLKKGVAFAEEPHDDLNQRFGQHKIDIILSLLEKLANSDDLVNKTLKKISCCYPNGFYLNKTTQLKKEFLDDLSIENPTQRHRNDAFPVNKTLQSINHIALHLCAAAIHGSDGQIAWLHGKLADTKDVKVSERERIVLKSTQLTFNGGSLEIGWFLSSVYQPNQDELISSVCKRIISYVIKIKNKTYEMYYFLFGQRRVFPAFFEKIELEDDLLKQIESIKDTICVLEICWLIDICLDFFKNSSESSNVFLKEKISGLIDSKKQFIDKLPESEKLLLLEKMVLVNGMGIEQYLNDAAKILAELTINPSNQRLQSLVLRKSIDILYNRKKPDLTPILKENIEILLKKGVAEKDFSIQAEGYLGLLFDEIQSFKYACFKYDKIKTFEALDSYFLDTVMDKYLLKGVFPPLGLGKRFYNPGLIDGITGLGYLLLHKHDKKTLLLPTQCFF